MRTLLRSARTAALAGVGAAMVAAAGMTIASAASDEVVILGIWPQSGPYADTGPLLDRGAQIALVGMIVNPT